MSDIIRIRRAIQVNFGGKEQTINFFRTQFFLVIIVIPEHSHRNPDHLDLVCKRDLHGLKASMWIVINFSPGLIVFIAAGINLNVQVRFTIYNILVFSLQRHSPGIPVILKLIRAVQRMPFKKLSIALIRITFIKGYYHCARAHPVPVGSIIPHYR